MDVSLVMIKDGALAQKAVLPPGKVLVGRDEGCKVRIPAASVSRRHCELEVTSDAITVRDLDSSNGTLVNGERVESAELKAGDRIAIGVFSFMVQVDGQPPALSGASPAGDVPAGSTADPMTGQAITDEDAPAGGGSVLDDLDLGAVGDAADESSMMDFDLDLGDDDAPKL